MYFLNFTDLASDLYHILLIGIFFATIVWFVVKFIDNKKERG